MLRNLVWILAVAVGVSVAAPVAYAQEKKPDAAKLLGQTPQTGSLPYWSKPSDEARKDLGQAARANASGVFLVGYPKFGHGTAWVISKKNRLLVTNAHVADLLHASGGKMVAIPNGTSEIYKVEKVWYHPGVRRFLEGNRGLSVRSMEPKEGDVDPHSPDLAILQLSNDGPELKVEFPIASADELANLFAQSAAIIGFPGHDTSWPQLGEKASSTFHDGVISRVTDFDLKSTGAVEEQQFLQYTMSDWGGFSGSPVLLPSGNVAAVHNMARTVKDKGTGEVKVIPHGIRVDCVVEMLVHHGLDEKVAFKIDKSKVNLSRWTMPDKRSEKARADFAKATQLVGEAWYQISPKQNFEAACDKCDAAIALVPNFAEAYQARSMAINNFCAGKGDTITVQSKVKLYRMAKADALKLVQIAPSDPMGTLLTCSVMVNIGVVRDDETEVRDALEILNKILTSESLPNHCRAQAHSYRAGANNFLGDKKAALRDHNEAIRLNPIVPVLWDNRALFWSENGREDLAEADRAKAREIRDGATAKGMKITELSDDGAAAKAGLKVGDIILKVGFKTVRSFETLAAALAKVDGEVEITFIDGKTGRRETLEVKPNNGKIGVAVDPVELD